MRGGVRFLNSEDVVCLGRGGVACGGGVADEPFDGDCVDQCGDNATSEAGLGDQYFRILPNKIIAFPQGYF